MLSETAIKSEFSLADNKKWKCKKVDNFYRPFQDSIQLYIFTPHSNSN